MSAQMKTQLLRIARLFGWSVAGALAPFVMGLHGPVTLAAIQGASVIALEAGFRAIVPSVEAQFASPTPVPATTTVPPAVF